MQGNARWNYDDHLLTALLLHVQRLQDTGYRIQDTGCSNSVQLKEYTGRLGPTQHELFRADWVKTRHRSWILSSDWFDVKSGYEITPYSYETSPPGFHIDWQLIT